MEKLMKQEKVLRGQICEEKENLIYHEASINFITEKLKDYEYHLNLLQIEIEEAKDNSVPP